MLNFSDYFSQGLNSTLRMKPGTTWSYKGQWVQVFTDTEIDRWYVGDFSSVDYQLTIEFNSNTKETLKLLLVASPNSVNIINYGSISVGNSFISFSATVNNSYVSLRATCDPGFQGSKLIFTAQYAETIGDLSPYAGPNTVIESPLRSQYGFQTTGFNVTNGLLQVDSFETDNISIGQNNNGISVVDGVVTLTSKIGSSGSMDNIVIGSTIPVNGTFTNLIAVDTVSFITTGNITINPDTVGSMDNINIGLVAPGDAQFVELTTTDFTTNDLLSSTGTITTLNSTTGTITTLNSTTGTITTLNSTTGTINNLTVTSNLSSPNITVDDIIINNAPTLNSHGTRKDYVNTIATALAIALGA